MRDYKQYTILDAQAATGIGKNIFVGDSQHITIMVSTASSANLTVKMQGAMTEEAPDFSAAQTVANQWDYIEMKDLQDGSAIDGDTGIAPAGTDDFRIFEVNVNGLQWINMRVTARAAGSVTATARLFTNG